MHNSIAPSPRRPTASKMALADVFSIPENLLMAMLILLTLSPHSQSYSGKRACIFLVICLQLRTSPRPPANDAIKLAHRNAGHHLPWCICVLIVRFTISRNDVGAAVLQQSAVYFCAAQHVFVVGCCVRNVITLPMVKDQAQRLKARPIHHKSCVKGGRGFCKPPFVLSPPPQTTRAYYTKCD